MATERMRQNVEAFGISMAYSIARMENNMRRQSKLADRRRKVIEALKADPSLTIRELAERFGVSASTAKRDRAAVVKMLGKFKCCPICGHALNE